MQERMLVFWKKQALLHVAVETLGGEPGPAEDKGDAGDVDDGLAGDALGHLADVGALDLLGRGQALEGVGLKGAHGVADGAHDGEVAAAGGADGGTSDDGRHFYWVVEEESIKKDSKVFVFLVEWCGCVVVVV